MAPACTELGLKALSNTSVLFQSPPPCSKLDAVIGRPPERTPNLPMRSHLSEHLLRKPEASLQDLISYRSLSQQPATSSLGSRSVSVDNVGLTGATEHPPTPFSSLAPPCYLRTLTEVSVQRGPLGPNKRLAKLALHPSLSLWGLSVTERAHSESTPGARPSTSPCAWRLPCVGRTLAAFSHLRFDCLAGNGSQIAVTVNTVLSGQAEKILNNGKGHTHTRHLRATENPSLYSGWSLTQRTPLHYFPLTERRPYIRLCSVVL